VTAVTAAELGGHPFLREMPDPFLSQLAGLASAVTVPAGHRFFEEGGHARMFWLLTRGRVALDLTVPGRPPLIVETLTAGDLMGVSWLAPPHEWQYGAGAVEPTAAYQIDGAAVIGLCDSDPRFGYQLFVRLMRVAARRLHSSRIRMLDLYAGPGPR
jgi:CRP/FNR family transcriptional regulator, cyclic AMP receptor protein